MAKKMLIGAAAASMVLAAAPAWAEVVPTDGTATGGGRTGITAVTSSTTAATANLKLKFPDVSQTHWALKHITKLAIEGIVEGNEYGEYRPEDQVTQEQVLVMAVRKLGLEDKAKGNTTTVALPQELNVSSYAKPYMVEAISQGLITIKEESDLSKASGKSGIWGARNASREWVAKIMVRMLGKQAEADGLANSSSAFTDNAAISAWALGYVNEAVTLGLVQGFEDGSFKPQGEVTRAQMATFLSRSESQSKTQSPRFAKGYVAALNGTKLTLQDADGNTTTYNLSSDTVFYGKKDDERIASGTIQQTYEVSVLQVNGTAYYVEVTNDQLQMDVYTGTLLKVDPAKLQVTLQSGDDYPTYDLASDVAVTDAAGQGSSLSALVKNSIIELRKNKLVKDSKISQIVIKQVPVNKTSEGTIQYLNRDTREFKVLDKTSGQIESYLLGDLVGVRLQSNTVGDLGSLHLGDTVSYTVANNLLTNVTVTKQIDIGVSEQGTLKGFVPSSGVLNIEKADGTLGAFFLSDTVKVLLDGKANAGLADLLDGDEVKLDLLNNKIQAITVTNRSIQNLLYATISGYDPATKVLTIVDSNGKPDAFTLTDKTALLYFGNSYPLSSFTSTFTNGKKIDVQVSKDKTVASLQLTTQLFGVVTAVNPQTNQITVKSGSQSVSFTMQFTPAIELFGKSNATLDDVKIGDTVTLELNPGQQDMITKITANKTVQYKVLLSNANARQLTLQDAAGANSVLTLDASVPIVAQGKSSPTFADILTEEYVNLTFKGNTITKAEAVTPIRGKTLAVDAAAGTVTVQDAAGQTQLVSVGPNAAVLIGNTAATLANVKAGDRIQIMMDVDGKWSLQVAGAFQKSYVSYSAAINQMTLASAAGTDSVTFNLYSRAYLHKGTQALTLSGFTAGDSVAVYVIDNKIIEMEKQ